MGLCQQLEFNDALNLKRSLHQENSFVVYRKSVEFYFPPFRQELRFLLQLLCFMILGFADPQIIWSLIIFVYVFGSKNIIIVNYQRHMFQQIMIRRILQKYMEFSKNMFLIIVSIFSDELNIFFIEFSFTLISI